MNDIELIDELLKRADEEWNKQAREFAIAELESLKAEIGIYYNDCLLSISDNDEECKICNKNVFESILRKINNHISELKGETNEIL